MRLKAWPSVSRLALVVAAAPIVFFVALLFVPSAAWAQGEPLGPEFRVNTYTPSRQNLPHVATDASGNFVVVWGSNLLAPPGSDYGVFGQRYDSLGAPLGPEFPVNTDTTANQTRPSVAADTSGNFIVVWESDTQDGSSWGVFGQRFASSGAPLGLEFRVNTYTTGSQRSPVVASDSSGNFVVVWQSQFQNESQYGVFGQRYASSGAPLGPEFRVNSYTSNTQEGPSVASDSSGNFVVVWNSLTQDGSDWGVFGQRFASTGAPLGTEFRVNTYTTNDQSGPSVATDASENFVVVWASVGQDGSDLGVFGQRYASSGAPLGPEFRVNTYTTFGQSGQRIATDASGNFVVVWHSGFGSDFDVFGQRYASSGAPDGPEFRVNTFTTSFQLIPAAASGDSSGNFVVVWASFQDGSYQGVYGQRYGRIVPVELIHFRVE